MTRSLLHLTGAALLAIGGSAQGPLTPTLLKDLNTDRPDPSTARGFNARQLARTAGRVVLAGQVEGYGYEPWVSDGTVRGTHLLNDLVLGPGSGNPYAAVALPNGAVVVAARSDAWGAELFTLPPGAGALQLARDIYPGPDTGPLSFGSSVPSALTEWHGEAWFIANDGVHGAELWRSDGTAAGTVLADDVNPGPGGISNGGNALHVAGGQLFFTTVFPAQALWVKSSPNAAPTRLLGLGPSLFLSVTMSDVGGLLLFTNDTPSAGQEVWRSDGTVAGTYLLEDVWPGQVDSRPRFVHSHAGRQWFVASTPSTGPELWITDGTTSNTRLVKDIKPGQASGFGFESIPFQGGLLFSGDDGVHGHELWFSDGTEFGTLMVVELWPGPQGSRPESMFRRGSEVLFSADDGVHGRELWATTGSPTFTRLVADIHPTGDSDPRYLGDVPGGVLLGASGAGTGHELWFSDGTTAGTRAVANLNPDPVSADGHPGLMTFYRGRLLFRARTAATGNELWSTDGTAAGTRLVADLAPGTNSSNVAPLREIDAGMLLGAITKRTGHELWITDGTTAGTRLVKHFDDGYAPQGLGIFGVLGEHAYVFADDGSGYGMWRTDGSTTVPIRGVPVVPAGRATELPGLLLFRAYRDDVGSELWATDGTAAGTRLVADLEPGPNGSAPQSLVRFGDRLVFTASTAATGNEPWITDGTLGGTNLLLDINPGPTGSGARSFIALGDRLLFTADDGSSGLELWITDGTTSGTNQVVDLVPGSLPSNPYPAHRATDGVVFFWADDARAKTELWLTDGTAAGTVRVATGPSTRTPLIPVGDGRHVTFTYDDLVHGRELWISDGTAAGTRILADSAPGPASGSPSAMVRLGDQLLFAATDRVTGAELHSIDLGAIGGRVAEPFGLGCGGEIRARGAPRLGHTLHVDAIASTASAPAVTFFATRPSFTRLAPLCWLHLDNPAAIRAGATDANGRLRTAVAIPNVPALSGIALYFQSAALAPGGPLAGRYELSPGLEVIIGP